MSTSEEREKSITIDPVNCDSEQPSDRNGGTNCASASMRDGDGNGPSPGDGLGFDEFILPVSGPSKEEILDTERRDVTPEVNSVIRKLVQLQLRCGLQKRFHLVIEKDADDSVQKWAEEGSSRITSCSPIECRILFSPTLVYDSPETKMLTKSMTTHLSAASFSALRRAIREEGETRKTNQRVSRQARIASNDSGAEITSSLDITRLECWDTFIVPDWFPFEEDMYRTGIQVSKTDLLAVSGYVANNFQRLSKDALEKIWSQFFRTLHDGVRKKVRKYSRLPFKYTLYTPPWLRKQIRVGTQLHQIGDVTIRPVRSQRSDWGYRSMALILAGFFEKELWFATPILNYLMNSLFKGLLGRNRRLSVGESSNYRPRKVRLNDNGHPATLSPNGNNNRRQKPDINNGDSEANSGHMHTKVRQPAAHSTGSVEAAPTEPPTTELRNDGVRGETGDAGREAENRPLVEDMRTATKSGISAGHEIVCAAKDQCRFREDPEAQKLSVITAKCSVCACPIHDLCGGGECDEKRCPQCRRNSD